jgi:general stress protein CsbA
MLRAIGSVVLGYVVMAAFVMLALTAAYLAMGAERAFQPGSYEVSNVWVITMFAVGVVAALAGGLVCAAIARSRKPALALAGLVLVLGVLSALPSFAATEDTPPKVRTGEVGNFEAMTQAKQPPWVALSHPLIGVIGVLVGARLKRDTTA